MPLEIERKFLVEGADLDGASVVEVRQGYIGAGDGVSVRVRLTDSKAYLSVKSAVPGMTRPEYEYEIPPDEASEMLELFCEGRIIEKKRYYLDHAGREWTIDVFSGANAGLAIAEVELESETAALEIPAWAVKEITDDPRFYNENLARSPYTRWQA